jgi:hypothetical protein
MKKKSRVIERENQGCLERLLITQLHTLRSLKTATKRRRALGRKQFCAHEVKERRTQAKERMSTPPSS